MAEITAIPGNPTGTEQGMVTHNIPWGTQGANIQQIGGIAIDANSGLKSAGTQRVVIATDQPALTNPLKVDGSAVTQPVSLAIAPTTPVTGTFWQATQPVSISGNQAANIVQMGSTAVSMNTGVRDAGTQRITIATNDSVPVTGTFWQTTQPVSGTVTANAGTGTFNIQANASVNTAQFGGFAPNFGVNHMITKTTWTPTSATAYISGIAVCCTAAGTAWTLQIKDKQVTAQILYSVTLSVGNTFISFPVPLKMTSGIDFTSAGTTAGIVDLWCTYYQ